jgi:uridine phosphorylase
MSRIPSSELMLHSDGSIYHLRLQPEQLADRVILTGDPSRISLMGEYLEAKECDVSNREYRAITGRYRGKRITLLSHGIGCGNIDIVMNELDALANIDFKTRSVKPKFRQLTLVRIGTSGSLQASVPLGAQVVAARSIGLDSVPYFYAGSRRVRDTAFEGELLRRLPWPPEGVRPYAVQADATLVKQIARNDMLRGVTLTASGFYAPQGRELRLPSAVPAFNAALEAFEWQGHKITNCEMESAPLAFLSALMGHRAMTVCLIIAARVTHQTNTDSAAGFFSLVERVLKRI